MNQTLSTSHLSIHCGCGARGRVSARFAGRKIRCRRCDGVVHVPSGRVQVEAPLGLGSDSGAVEAVRARREAWPEPEQLELQPAVERPRARSLQQRSALQADYERKATLRRNGRRDIDHECHVRAIGVWFRIHGLLLGLASMAIVLLGGQAGVVPSAILGLIGGGTFAVGHFLWRYQSWARWVTVVLSGLQLGISVFGAIGAPGLGAIVGLATNALWHGGTIWVLAGARGSAIFSEDYADVVAATKNHSVPFWTSPFFYVPAILLALGLGLIALSAAALAALH